jgi:hypothetical protein
MQQLILAEGGFEIKLHAYANPMDDHFEWSVYDLELD